MFAQIVIVLLIACLGQTNAVEDKLVIEVKKVDQECLNILANTTHEQARCDFYKCFEERFPCGSNHYIMNVGHKYCIRYESKMGEFTATGVDLINHMIECIPRELGKLYVKKRSFRCYSLRKQMYGIQENCYGEKIELFCQGMRENRKVFGKSMDIMDVLNGDAIGMMKRLSEKCGEKGDILSLALKYGRK